MENLKIPKIIDAFQGRQVFFFYCFYSFITININKILYRLKMCMQV